MGYGVWGMVYGEWRMENGSRGDEDGRWFLGLVSVVMTRQVLGPG